MKEKKKKPHGDPLHDQDLTSEHLLGIIGESDKPRIKLVLQSQIKNLVEKRVARRRPHRFSSPF